MQDVLFDNRELLGVGESTRQHQEDILLMHKGWNKFFPHIGVGVIDYFDDEEEAEGLVKSVRIEFEKDGMNVNNVGVDSEGKIYSNANY